MVTQPSTTRPRYIRPVRTSVPPRPRRIAASDNRQLRRTTIRQRSWLSSSHWWFILGSFCLVSIAFWAWQRFFVVKTIICTLADKQTPCSRSLLEGAETLLGKRLFFSNFRQPLQNLRTDQLSFTDVSYEKYLPDTLAVRFDFPSPTYQLSAGGQVWLSFAADGHYTIAPASAQVLQVNLHDDASAQNWLQYRVDDFVGQKMTELAFLSENQRATWRAVDFYAVNDVRITTGRGVYILSLLEVDRQLQMLQFIETGHIVEDDFSPALIDLRRNPPVASPL